MPCIPGSLYRDLRAPVAKVSVTKGSLGIMRVHKRDVRSTLKWKDEWINM